MGLRAFEEASVHKGKRQDTSSAEVWAKEQTHTGPTNPKTESLPLWRPVAETPLADSTKETVAYVGKTRYGRSYIF